MGPGPGRLIELSDWIENINSFRISLTNYKGSKWVREGYGAAPSILRSWANEGMLRCVRVLRGKRLYNSEQLLGDREDPSTLAQSSVPESCLLPNNVPIYNVKSTSSCKHTRDTESHIRHQLQETRATCPSGLLRTPRRYPIDCGHAL